MARFFRFLAGYLMLCVRGEKAERFLNLCSLKGIFAWNVSREGEMLIFNVRWKDFYKMHSLVRKTKVRVAIRKRIGLPFFIPKTLERLPFLLGAMIVTMLWIGSASYLWNVEFIGNQKITNDQMRDFLKENGIKLGMPLKKIELARLEKGLMRVHPDLTWTSITIKGTKLLIAVKENEIQKREEKIRHVGMELISPSEGRIVSMIVRSGVPMVKIGDEVKKGQVLLTGMVPIMGEDGNVKNWMEVDADGDVVLERTRFLEDSLCFYYVDKKMTGRETVDYYVKAGNHYLFRDGKKAYYRENTLETDVSNKVLLTIGAPFRIFQVKRQEWLPVLRKRNEREGLDLLEKKMSSFLISLEEKGIQIIDKNVKIDSEGDFWLLHGEVLTWEKAELFRESEKGIDGKHD